MTQGPRSWPRRLHSITGLVPIGGFLAFHLYENTAAARGADAYNEAARQLQQMPLAPGLEIGVIILPILFHGVYGLFLAASERDSPAGETRVRRTLLVLQRATGVVVFAFILFHLWTTRLVQLSDHEALDLFYLVRATLANPWIYAFYVAGTLSATFHLANGLWSFSVDWGIATGPKARRAMAAVSGAVFLVLSLVGVRAISAFRVALP
jgi:succinate dehydrogenase / fumarate reductase cytochrome b subunit